MSLNCMQVMSVLALVFLFSFVRNAHSQCDVPPESWCDNAVIAQKCGVYEQCKKNGLLKTTNDGPRPVEFVLYYEAFCPYCKDYITETLPPVWSALQSIMNITMLPFGWAEEKKKEGDRYIFECDNGPEECKGHLIEACAIDLLKNVSVYLPFIGCLEKSDNIEKAAPICGKAQGLDVNAIMTCSTSIHGNVLMHEIGLKTTAVLKPNHDMGVPWISIDGDHSTHIQNLTYERKGLMKVICDYYEGKQKPPACSNP